MLSKASLLIGPLGAGTPIQAPTVEFQFQALPAAFDGFRLAVVSDIHFNHFATEAYVRKALALALAGKPDVVILNGDLVMRSKTYARRLGPILADYTASCPFFAALGNHDPRRGIDFTAILRQAGVQVLRNEHRILHRGQESIALAGLDDLMAGQPDFPAAAAGIPPRTFTILLAHNPDLADLAPPGLPGDLMIAGHTHGGQIRPFGRPIVTETRNRRYCSGIVRGPRFPVFISRGLGTTAIPIRLNCPPELPTLVLRRQVEAANR
jgi:hypothetical protein